MTVDPRNYRGIFVAGASREWGCADGISWPPCRCARCVIRYTGGRLVRRYGRDRTVEILAGRDAAASADLAAWNRLGSRKRAAA